MLLLILYKKNYTRFNRMFIQHSEDKSIKNYLYLKKKNDYRYTIYDVIAEIVILIRIIYTEMYIII